MRAQVLGGRRRGKAVEAMGYLHAVDRTNSMTEGGDPWATARDGEVWWWDGERLVPTSPGEAAIVREIDAMRRLRDWEGNVRTKPARSRAGNRTQRNAVWSAVVGWLLLRRERTQRTSPPAQQAAAQVRR